MANESFTMKIHFEVLLHLAFFLVVSAQLPSCKCCSAFARNASLRCAAFRANSISAGSVEVFGGEPSVCSEVLQGRDVFVPYGASQLELAGLINASLEFASFAPSPCREWFVQALCLSTFTSPISVGMFVLPSWVVPVRRLHSF